MGTYSLLQISRGRDGCCSEPLQNIMPQKIPFLRDTTLAWLKDLMRQRPEARGYFANQWTVPLLQEELFHGTGRYVSADTIRRSLDRLGYVWKRARYVLAPDPEKGKKRQIFR
jgi:transposase